MTTPAFLNWPFFEARHRALHAEVAAWCAENLDAAPSGTRDSVAARGSVDARDSVDAHCTALVRKLGSAGLLRHCVRANHGGAAADFDVRSIAIIRESLARFDGLADFAFASTCPMPLRGPLLTTTTCGWMAPRSAGAPASSKEPWRPV